MVENPNLVHDEKFVRFLINQDLDRQAVEEMAEQFEARFAKKTGPNASTPQKPTSGQTR